MTLADISGVAVSIGFERLTPCKKGSVWSNVTSYRDTAEFRSNASLNCDASLAGWKNPNTSPASTWAGSSSKYS